MKLSTIKSILVDMKKIYPYEDEETDFMLRQDVRSCRENGVEIRTTDNETGVIVNLTKYAEREDLI